MPFIPAERPASFHSRPAPQLEFGAVGVRGEGAAEAKEEGAAEAKEVEAEVEAEEENAAAGDRVSIREAAAAAHASPLHEFETALKLPVDLGMPAG